jgi:hypothetical protein
MNDEEIMSVIQSGPAVKVDSGVVASLPEIDASPCLPP